MRKDENVKPKIASTIKEIELHRRELETLRARLELRRKSLFDTTVKALMTKDKSKASVYANEWTELRKVGKVVYASELALTQVILRLESIVDVGDVMAHMSMAFKVLRKVNKTVQGLVPSLDQASSDINSTLTETMAEMGNVSPSINLNISTESGEELIEQAKLLAAQRGEEMTKTLSANPRQIQKDAETFEDRVPLLASGDEDEEELSQLGTLFRNSAPRDAEEQLLQYAAIHDGKVDVTDATGVFSLPADDVEQAMLKLVSEGRVKPAKLLEAES